MQEFSSRTQRGYEFVFFLLLKPSLCVLVKLHAKVKVTSVIKRSKNQNQTNRLTSADRLDTLGGPLGVQMTSSV